MAIFAQARIRDVAVSEAPQGIMAIVKQRDCRKVAMKYIGKANRIVIARQRGRPGNLGTMIRTAAAFGYDLFICLGDCAEI
jgi:tRNA G18 (ribose-2'-O)-methylase SpoU